MAKAKIARNLKKRVSERDAREDSSVHALGSIIAKMGESDVYKLALDLRHKIRTLRGQVRENENAFDITITEDDIQRDMLDLYHKYKHNIEVSRESKLFRSFKVAIISALRDNEIVVEESIVDTETRRFVTLFGATKAQSLDDASVSREVAGGTSDEGGISGRPAPVMPPVVPPQSWEQATAQFLAAAEIPEQTRPALASAITQLIEEARRNPDAVEARLAALTAAPAAKMPIVAPPPPETAPEFYRNRPRDPKTGRQEFVEPFFTRVYAPWIVDGVFTIPREKLKELDPEAAFALSTRLNNHKEKPLPFKPVEDSKEGPPYTAEQVKRARAIARWGDRHRDELEL